MKSKGFCSKALVISSFLLLVAVVWAQGLGEWKVLVATEANEQTAKSRLENDLMGIEGLEIQLYKGQWSILYGAFENEAAAKKASVELANREGLLLRGVAFISSSNGSSASATAPVGSSRYRVLVSRFSTESEASERQKELQGEGIVPVDIVPSSGDFLVLVGYEYNTYAKAEKYVSILQKINIVTDSIVDLENVDKVDSGEFSPSGPVRAYKVEMDNYIDLGDYIRARETLDEWRQDDPNNLDAMPYEKKVKLLEDKQNLKNVARNEELVKYEVWLKLAADLEADENYDRAIDIQKDISRLNVVSEAQRRTAMQKIGELAKLRNEQDLDKTRKNWKPDSEGSNMGLIIGIVIGALVLIGGGAFFVMKKKKGAGTTTVSAEQISQLSAAPPTPSPIKEKTQASTTASETEVDLRQNKKPAPKEDHSPIPITKESQAEPAAKPALEQQPQEEEFVQVAPSSAQKQYFFQQDFQDEEVGQSPKNWDGNYDYASLLVAEDSGQRCMKFDKASGTGSALFQCKFPNAGGRVGVEFDMRCDHKNKYLLGFYIEKDADFRHSVHTVVHRDLANPDNITLRLQNETAPYQLNHWVHIKFLIDLPRSIVDASIDGKQVALGVRLTSKPNVVNTLSIRDNLATEGTLLIRNIEIYRES